MIDRCQQCSNEKFREVEIIVGRYSLRALLCATHEEAAREHMLNLKKEKGL